MDTRATERQDGIIVPDISGEGDSLIGEQENSFMDNSQLSKGSREELI